MAMRADVTTHLAKVRAAFLRSSVDVRIRRWGAIVVAAIVASTLHNNTARATSWRRHNSTQQKHSQQKHAHREAAVVVAPLAIKIGVVDALPAFCARARQSGEGPQRRGRCHQSCTSHAGHASVSWAGAQQLIDCPRMRRHGTPCCPRR